jgi:two-component system, OmpR family, sensor histidine kinase RstB
MLRLYLRFYLALLASLLLFVLGMLTLYHFKGTYWPASLGLIHTRMSAHIVITTLALLIGIGAFPIVRQISKRLERLQRGVEALGAGNFTARISVEGRDEVAQLARAFNDAAGRIEELLGAHKALLANASHELRTPLTRIRLAVELMKDRVDPRHKEGLEQDIAELDRLVDEILLASRLDAVTDTRRIEDIDLLALAAEECARYDEAHLEGSSVTIRGDSRLLRRLLRNLLENARRHGSPPTEVRIAREAASAVITVRDGGPGVPESELESVFRPFYRPRDTDGSSGAGLGLALVRQIARRHGGEARCTLENGRSAFVIVLPTDHGPR